MQDFVCFRRFQNVWGEVKIQAKSFKIFQMHFKTASFLQVFWKIEKQTLVCGKKQIFLFAKL